MFSLQTKKMARVIRAAFISETSNREFPLGFLKKLREEAEEESTSLEVVLINNHINDELSNIMKEYTEDAIQNEIDKK